MDQLSQQARAIEFASTVVGRVRADQLTNPTPSCPDWTVRDLLNHLVGSNYFFGAAARGEQLDPAGEPSDHLGGGEPAAAFSTGATALLEAFSAPGALDKTLHMPFGDLPGSLVLNIHLGELVVHAWDLAKATGQDTEIDPEAAEATYLALSAMVTDEIRNEHTYTSALAVPADASAQERLLAFVGREP